MYFNFPSVRFSETHLKGEKSDQRVSVMYNPLGQNRTLERRQSVLECRTHTRMHFRDFRGVW
jgi:hypothetical protein